MINTEVIFLRLRYLFLNLSISIPLPLKKNYKRSGFGMSQMTMYKVIICDSVGNEFETNMPSIPRVGESIRYWTNNECKDETITQIVYEFDNTGSYVCADIYI